MLAVVRRSSAGEALPAAALALLAAATAGPRPLLVGLLWLAAVTPRLIEVDLAEHRLPDAVVLPGVPVVLASVVLDRWSAGAEVLPVLAAAAAIGLVMLLLHLTGGLGFGDVKLAPLLAALAAAAAPGGALVALVLAFLAGGVASAVVLVRHGRSARLAFGPALLLGAWTAVLLLV